MTQQPMFRAEDYEKQRFGSQNSASIIVPVILDIFPYTKSVVDVGCGVGAWLAAFTENGVPSIKGFEGGTPDPAQLKVPASAIEKADLRAPPKVVDRYDLAISLEVAEHLPQSSANDFVQFLCRLSDHIVFSAAIPLQGGKDHINEQPLSYWRTLFAEQGYALYDCIRPQIWNDDRIQYWYRQNMVIAISERLARSDLRKLDVTDLIDVVHPALLQNVRSSAAAKIAAIKAAKSISTGSGKNRWAKYFNRYLWARVRPRRGE